MCSEFCCGRAFEAASVPCARQARERAFKKQRLDKAKEAREREQENERIKEAGRRLREEKEKELLRRKTQEEEAAHAEPVHDEEVAPQIGMLLYLLR